ncbi:MAG: hypothetical protein HY237_08650 [Acidobacteria bacterium]|nr:hypothetical protein [Acidobacteriota bacterium]
MIREAISPPNSTSPVPFNSHKLRAFSIITFNYDLCADFAFHFGSIPVRYCLDVSEDEDALPLLKLHGSLNWGTCSVCGKVVPWFLSNFFEGRYWDLAGLSNVTLRLSSMSREFKHCPSGGVSGPYVVPPTWNKAQYHEYLEPVWRGASAELADAENIFICGYSLPDTDNFFTYLYALGTIGQVRLKRLWVFNPDAEVETRFQELLGQGASSRFMFFPKRFDEMFYEVRPVFGLTAN